MGKLLKLAGLGLVLIGLVGCDMVEKSAQEVAEKAEKTVQDAVSKTLDGTLETFNKQVDELQQSVNKWLPPAEPKEDQQPPSEQHEHNAIDPAAPLSDTTFET